MAIPKYYEMYKSFLKVLLDGKIHSSKEEKQQIIDDFQLTEKETAELLPSGRQAIFDNRVGWCRTYLKKAGLIISPTRGQYKITDAGSDIRRLCGWFNAGKSYKGDSGEL